MLAPKKIVTAKKSPKFFAIVDNFQLISGKDQQIKKSEKLFIIYKPSHVRGKKFDVLWSTRVPVATIGPGANRVPRACLIDFSCPLCHLRRSGP